MRTYSIYILASLSRVLYVGMTSDLPKRIHQHKQKTFDGFSARYDATRLVYFEQTTDAYAAVTRERQIKGWSREKKLALVDAANPDWDDLAGLL